MTEKTPKPDSVFLRIRKEDGLVDDIARLTQSEDANIYWDIVEYVRKDTIPAELSELQKQLLSMVRFQDKYSYKMKHTIKNNDGNTTVMIDVVAIPKPPVWKVGDGFEYNGKLRMVIELNETPEACSKVTQIEFPHCVTMQSLKHKTHIPREELLKLASERAEVK